MRKDILYDYVLMNDQESGFNLCQAPLSLPPPPLPAPNCKLIGCRQDSLRARGAGGARGAAAPPTFLADNVNLLNVLSWMHTCVRACRRGGSIDLQQTIVLLLLHVQCFRRLLIVCLTKETQKYICLCFLDSQPIYIIGLTDSNFTELPGRSATYAQWANLRVSSSLA